MHALKTYNCHALLAIESYALFQMPKCYCVSLRGHVLCGITANYNVSLVYGDIVIQYSIPWSIRSL